MLAEFRTWSTSPTSPVSEGLAALRSSAASSNGDGAVPQMLLGYTPVARMNSYQAQLYRTFGRNGIAVVGVNDPWEFARLADARSACDKVAVHLHWLNFYTLGANTAAGALARVDRLTRTLETFKENGGAVIWTVHNRLPHDTVYEQAEVALRQVVADRADVVHVMTASTPQALLEVGVHIEPGKVVHSPHPNYVGAFPDSVTRAEARQTLGIEPDERVLVLFGAIKPYKGLTLLLRAFEQLRVADANRYRLIVAGQPDESPAAEEFVQKCMLDPDILIAPKKIANEHVQYYLRAADAGLAPYDRVLNSGAVRLYETFGLPVVVPNQDAVVSTVSVNAFTAFEPGDQTGLVNAMRDAISMDRESLSASLEEHVAQHDASILADSFAQELRSRLLVTARP